MCGEEITLEDLLAGEPEGREPRTFRQLLADGLPLGCGLGGLSVIERLGDPGPELAALRLEYLRLLEAQRRGIPGIH